MNESMKWIDTVRGADSIREVARKSGIPQPTLARQVNAGQLTFESTRDISRAYGRSVLADLVSVRHLTHEDVGIDGIDRALAAASDEQLVSEVARRLDIAPSSTMWDSPISQASEVSSNVVRGPQAWHDGIEDAGIAEPPLRHAADNGEHAVDRIPAVDEDPDTAPEHD